MMTLDDCRIEIKERYLRIKWFVAGDGWLTAFGQWLCERGGHKPGVWWFNPGGSSPDMRCKRCGRDLG